LQTISGDNIEFEREPLLATLLLIPFLMTILELNIEIEKLLKKGIIKPSTHEQKEFVSQIFTTRKSDGRLRLILNLKILNQNIKYEF